MLRNKIQKSPAKAGSRQKREKFKIQNYNSRTKNILKFLKFALPVFCLLVFGFYLSSFAQEEFTYDAAGRRNPFIALVTPDGRLLKLEPKETVSGLLLEGIIYDNYGLSYAIVNGEIVKVGDQVGDYQVIKIEEKRVIFVKEGEPTEVELKEEEP